MPQWRLALDHAYPRELAQGAQHAMASARLLAEAGCGSDRPRLRRNAPSSHHGWLAATARALSSSGFRPDNRHKTTPHADGKPVRYVISPKSLSKVSRSRPSARACARTASSPAPAHNSLTHRTSWPCARSARITGPGTFSFARIRTGKSLMLAGRRPSPTGACRLHRPGKLARRPG